jgi:PhnB protein
VGLRPYLFFQSSREPMSRYQEVLGGQLEVMTLAEVPEGHEPPFEAPADFVVHASLTFGDGDVLMASDDPGSDGAGVKGAAVAVSLADQDEARRVFDGLAEGGTVQMPMAETFWSPLFGSCVDRFGVTWFVDVEPAG